MDAARALALAGLLLACAVPAGRALRLAGLEEKRTSGRAERWLLAGGRAGAPGDGLHPDRAGRTFHPALVLLPPPALALALFQPGRPVPLRSRPGRPPAGDGKRFPGPVEGGHRGGAGILALAVLVQDPAPRPTTTACCTTWWPPRSSCMRCASLPPSQLLANLPALGELLYAFGLAGGSDRAPQASTPWPGAWRWASPTPSGRASSVPGRRWGLGLAGHAPVPFLATRAYIDLFTVLYGLVAVCAVLRWHETGPGGGRGVGPQASALGGKGAWLRVAGGPRGWPWRRSTRP